LTFKEFWNLEFGLHPSAYEIRLPNNKYLYDTLEEAFYLGLEEGRTSPEDH